MSGNVTGNLPGIGGKGGIGSLPGLSSLLGGGSPLGGAVGAMDPAAGFMGSLKGLFGGG